MSHRRSILAVLIASAIASTAAAFGAMSFATSRYEASSAEGEIARIGDIVNRTVADRSWGQFATEAAALAQDIAQEAELRSAVGAGDAAAIGRFAPNAWRRNVVTSGAVPLLGVTLMRPDGVVLASHAATGPGVSQPAEISPRLAARQGNDRLQQIRHIWLANGEPRLTVIVPVGGLRLVGYLAVHVDPLHPLQGLDTRIGTSVDLKTLDATRSLARLTEYKLPPDALTRQARITVKGPDYRPLFIADLAWDISEASATMGRDRTWALALVTLVIGFIALATIASILVLLKRLAKAEADKALAESERLNRLEEEARQREATLAEEAEVAKRAELSALAESLDDTVKRVAYSVGVAASQIAAHAESMKVLAGRTSEEAVAAASASHQASANVQSVSAATEQLTAAIVEIGSQVARAGSMSGKAVEEAGRVSDKVTNLGSATSRIGEVINLISSIAAQTNLLALNATIEAARAGEAGRGFAVVANEVKQLAAQTAKATGDISAQIGAVQAATGEVVGAIEAITGTISEIAGIQSGIAGSIDEQQAATAEIARNAVEASAGATAIASSIDVVRGAADDSGAKARDLHQAAGSLDAEARELKQQVETFIARMRVA
jgi:methyl-accepting chemotaxis protein